MTELTTTGAKAAATCRGCAAAMAGDQRYCLNCGTRRGAPRLSMDEVLGSVTFDLGAAQERPASDIPVAAAVPAARATTTDRTQVAILVIAAIILPAFGIGLLLGDRGNAPAAAAPQVITVAAPAALSSTTAPAAFADSWPAGRDGWTIQLAALAKTSTQPADAQRAVADAQAKGVADVGALDSDAHPSLAGGSYVVYSGVFDSERQAKDALAARTTAFPDASVVHVGAPAGSAETGTSPGSTAPTATTQTPPKASSSSPQKLTPQQYQKKSKNLPKTATTGGDPPPKDDKAPGGGSDAIEIG